MAGAAADSSRRRTKQHQHQQQQQQQQQRRFGSRYRYLLLLLLLAPCMAYLHTSTLWLSIAGGPARRAGSWGSLAETLSSFLGISRPEEADEKLEIARIRSQVAASLGLSSLSGLPSGAFGRNESSSDENVGQQMDELEGVRLEDLRTGLGQLEKIRKAIQALGELAAEASGQVDGMVEKLNSNGMREEMGAWEGRSGITGMLEDRSELQQLAASATEMKAKVAGAAMGVIQRFQQPDLEQSVRMFGHCGLTDPKKRSFLPVHSPSRLLEWQPKQGKYLLALCSVGQMSNRIECFRLYLSLAALLNRTLIIPMSDMDPKLTGYAYNPVFDVAHLRSCLTPLPAAGVAASRGGRRQQQQQAVVPVAMTLKEFLTEQKAEFVTVKIICLWPGHGQYGWCGFRNGCLQPEASLPSVKVLGGKCERKNLEAHPRVDQLLEAIGHRPNRVISFGNVNYIGFSKMRWMQAFPNGPFRVPPQCQNVVQPHKAVISSAQSIVRDVLGANFISVHLRRGDFEAYCQKKETLANLQGKGVDCYHPLRQLADCVGDRINTFRGAINTVFVATNAGRHSSRMFREMIKVRARFNVSVVYMADIPKDTLPIKTKNWHAFPVALAATEKYLCALGKVFLGTPGSTFTVEIHRFRQGLNTSSCLDDFICADEPSESRSLFGKDLGEGVYAVEKKQAFAM